MTYFKWEKITRLTCLRAHWALGVQLHGISFYEE